MRIRRELRHSSQPCHPPAIDLQSPESLTSTPAAALAPGIVADTLKDQGLCEELVHTYFKLIHDKQHIIFHRPSFIADHRAGRAPDYLLLAMIALVAR